MELQKRMRATASLHEKYVPTQITLGVAKTEVIGVSSRDLDTRCNSLHLMIKARLKLRKVLETIWKHTDHMDTMSLYLLSDRNWRTMDLVSEFWRNHFCILEQKEK